MAGRTANKRGGQATGLKPSRVVIALAALVTAAGVALLMMASTGSNPASQSGGATGNKSAGTSDSRARQVSYDLVNSYPHDPTSFTQGLLWHEGSFYESTGRYGQSKLRRLEFPSGKVLKEISLAPDLFGEGLALVDGRLIQLTWTTHRAFVYDLDTFRVVQEFAYDTEGWGLTYDGRNLILSDGSSELTYLDPRSYRPLKKLPVTLNDRPVTELNELEFIEGEIWSNVWQTDLIVRIDPASGRVTSFLNLSGIGEASMRSGGDAVLNGIAYDRERKRVFITGKLWPRIFEIKVK